MVLHDWLHPHEIGSAGGERLASAFRGSHIDQHTDKISNTLKRLIRHAEGLEPNMKPSEGQQPREIQT